MKETDKEATSIPNTFEDVTEIIESPQKVEHQTSSDKEDETSVVDSPATAEEETKNKHKAAKALGGIAAGAAVMGSAAAVFMHSDETSESVDTEEAPEEKEVIFAAEEVELPELIVEAIGPHHDESDELTLTNESRYEVTVDSSETVYAQVVDPKPETGEYISSSQPRPEEIVAPQASAIPAQDPDESDIPIVSVGSMPNLESDVEILGISQDISTGYNVGRLSVDGEEVVVIDVDGDMVFDSMVADLNHDGDITADEIIDISQHSLTLDNIEHHSDIFTDPLAGDAPDYLTDLVN